MTEIAFHFNVEDKLAYSCRLLRKAYAVGATVAVTGEAELLHVLDALLWSFSATDFVPHCVANASAICIASSPVVLTEMPQDCSEYEVLLNLGEQVPIGFEGYKRFIEIVALPPEDAAAGRRRWRHYAERGYALKRHDLGGTGGKA